MMGVALAMFGGGAALALGAPYTTHMPRPFDARAWAAAKTNFDDTRCGMIADLKYRVGIAGKSREDLGRLLGEPEILPHRDPAASYWLLCPSFLDIWVLRIDWIGDRAISSTVHDT